MARRALTRISYLAAARRLRHYADQIEHYAGARMPREIAARTRAIHGAASYTHRLAALNRR